MALYFVTVTGTIMKEHDLLAATKIRCLNFVCSIYNAFVFGFSTNFY